MLSENPPAGDAAAPSVCLSRSRCARLFRFLFERQFILVFETDRARTYTNVHMYIEPPRVGWRRERSSISSANFATAWHEIVCDASIRILSCDANYTQHKTELTLAAASKSKVREWRNQDLFLRKVPLRAKHTI